MKKRTFITPTSLLAIVALTTGCASHIDLAKDIEPKIESLGGKYKICRENCPLRTPKELDEEQPFLTYIKPFKLLIPATENQNTEPKNNSQAALIQPQITDEAAKILFDFGMSKPNKIGVSALFKFIKTPIKSPIELVGGTDDIGTKNFNNALASSRAKFIKKWLLTHGVAMPVTITTRAECCRPAPYDKTAEALQGKRKVSIFYVKN
ncbi:MAG: hypothetical protein ACXWTX_04505 [Gallionella sp.]